MTVKFLCYNMTSSHVLVISIEPDLTIKNLPKWLDKPIQ